MRPFENEVYMFIPKPKWGEIFFYKNKSVKNLQGYAIIKCGKLLEINWFVFPPICHILIIVYPCSFLDTYSNSLCICLMLKVPKHI